LENDVHGGGEVHRLAILHGRLEFNLFSGALRGFIQSVS
jgi:hypothetical protein